MGGAAYTTTIVENGGETIDTRDELKLSIITDEYEYSEWIIDANC